ncbi:MAG: STAS domain-containing protein [Phycisphaeraceae bacterium]|nr:STAS domain-containing protein [Phycisphaeraceae bacterium]
MFESTHLHCTVADGVVVATIKCEKIGEYEATVLQTELQDFIKGFAWKVAMDFAQVQLLASVGLGLLVTINKTCKANKGKAALYNLNDNLINLLKITRLNTGLTICRSQDEAVKAAK